VIQRRAVVGIVIAVTASLLTACGFESPDVEASEHASVQAADFSVGTIKLADTTVMSTSDTPPVYYLTATIVNDGTTRDQLTGATTTGGTVTLSGSGVSNGKLTLLPGVPVEIGAAGIVAASSPGAPSQTTIEPTLVVTTTPAPQVGGFVPVVFTFANAGPSATVQVPVVPSGETTAPTQAVPTGTASVPPAVGPSADD
jgi:hypothetical protein